MWVSIWIIRSGCLEVFPIPLKAAIDQTYLIVFSLFRTFLLSLFRAGILNVRDFNTLFSQLISITKCIQFVLHIFGIFNVLHITFGIRSVFSLNCSLLVFAWIVIFLHAVIFHKLYWSLLLIFLFIFFLIIPKTTAISKRSLGQETLVLVAWSRRVLQLLDELLVFYRSLLTSWNDRFHHFIIVRTWIAVIINFILNFKISSFLQFIHFHQSQISLTNSYHPSYFQYK